MAGASDIRRLRPGFTYFPPDGLLIWVKDAASSDRLILALREPGGLVETLASGMTLSWAADKSVELDDCIVKNNSCGFDARLDTQVEPLRAALVVARETER